MPFLNRLIAMTGVCAFILPGLWAWQNTQSGASSQDVIQSDKVLRSNTRLVVVDVVATGSNGQLISDLKAEDFNLQENGRPQKISNFSFRAPVTKRIARAQFPPNVISNAPTFEASSLDVMLVDTLNGEFSEVAYVKDQLVKYLGSTQLQSPVALFAMQDRLELLHDFTTDNTVLKSTIERFKVQARNNNADTVNSIASAFTTHGDFHTDDRRISQTLNELNALAKILSGYPGRKNLIWLSESFPVNLFPDIIMTGQQAPHPGASFQRGGGGSATGGPTGIPTNGGIRTEGTGQGSYKDYTALIKKVSEALMNAQVAVYTVDAGAIGKDSRLESQHTANEIAGATGGKAFHNTNDLAQSMSASVDDGSSYYTLEYYPDNKSWDGQFRQIQIKARRPGVTLRYRLGYYALDPEKMRKDETSEVGENFSRALQLDTPAATGVLFQAQVINTPGKKVLVNFHIDPTTLAFEHQDDGHERGRFSCTVWAYGKDKDKPANMVNDTVNANLNAHDYQEMMKQHFLPCSRELDLKPGTYTLRVGVLDRTTNKMGTSSVPVTVQ